MGKEQIYRTKIKFKGSFNLAKFYETLHNILSDRNWEGLPGKDYYETYYYHRITPDGLNFVEIKWEAKKNFYSGEFTISWYLTINILVNAYKDNKGEIEIEIKGEHEIEEIKEPEAKSFFEKFLISISRFKTKWLKKTLEKTIKAGDKKGESAKNLYIECEEIKGEIIKFLKAYSY